MNYIESITDFFKSPKWMMNMLLAGICCFIPFVGPMVVIGWLITGFWCRPSTAPESFPDFDFDNFAKWLERGLWPLITAMATSFALYIIFMIPMAIIMMVIGGVGASTDSQGGGALSALLFLVVFGMYCLLLLSMIFLMKPIMLKAALTQDFAKAFDFGFIKSFITRTWLEMIISSIFLAIASSCLAFMGMIALCVGFIFVPGVLYFAMAHLDKQLYNLYLSRGGEPIQLSPKLNDSVIPPML